MEISALQLIFVLAKSSFYYTKLVLKKNHTELIPKFSLQALDPSTLKAFKGKHLIILWVGGNKKSSDD